jgi:hypothetical protein
MVVAVGEVAGASAAFAFGGKLVAIFDAGSGWRLAMLWLIVPLVLVMLAMLAMREPMRSGSNVEKPSAREALSELWRYRAFIVPLLTGRIMVGIADGAAMIWGAPTLSRTFGLAADRTGAIMAMVLLVSGLLGPIAGGMVADLCQRSGGPRQTVSALMGLALVSVPASLFALAPGVGSASFLLTTFIAVCGATVVIGTALTIVVIPNELRGFCMSVFMAVGVLFGVGLAPVTVSLLSSALGGAAMIGDALALVSVTACLFNAVTFAIGKRSFPRIAVQ